MKPQGLLQAVLRATVGEEGPKAYWHAYAASAEAYEADPPAHWDLLSPLARVAMIEGSTRTAIQALGVRCEP
jgi:hypothetical protein